jgi:phage terminase small subunit
MPKTKLPTARQSQFVLEYLTCLDATAAAKAAGYSERTAYQIGHDLLSKPEIEQAIAKVLGKALLRKEVSVERVLAEYVELAFFDPASLFSPDGEFLNIHEMPIGARRCIAGMDVQEIKLDDSTRATVKKIRFAPKTESLKALGTYLKMFVDNNTVVNQTLIVNQVNELIDEQSSARAIEARLSREVGRHVTIAEVVAALRQEQLAAANGKLS